ncbi:MAG TPA: hypothetical protein DDW95_12775 [Alphaproteobacteria bacterium]|nr:hypothetical protein [Alphaproteobacteria bacterium]HBF99418.1 hypothetical protein [Alphaproteobacteria bacterium]
MRLGNRLKRYVLLCGLLTITVVVCNMPYPALGNSNPKNWVVYYHNELPPSAFEDYDIVVFDSEHHPSIQSVQAAGATVYGYISLGEVEQYRSHFEAVKKDGILLRENVNWPGSYYVDMRSRAWTERVIYELVPEILRSGFDGIFIDTLDNPIELEQEDPVKYRGMADAAAMLVRTIAAEFPETKIIVNRGYEILPQIAASITGVLGESVYTTYDFEEKRAKPTTKDDYTYQVDMLKSLKKINPDLIVMTLDYWDISDTQRVRELYAKQRSNGFLPYVATVDLHKLIPEPAP